MSIRPYRAADAAALSDIYRRAVENLGPRDYSAAQVAAWASLAPAPDDLHRRIGDGRTALVAVDGDDRPVAFADLEADGHIDLFYCAPEVAGTGVAAALYDALEAAAHRLAVARLHVEASEAARRFLLRRGFTVLRKREFEIATVPIHNYAMEKSLQLRTG